jgi:hypothetical protein
MKPTYPILILIAFVNIFFTSQVLSQGEGDTINCFVESGAIVSTGKNTPFWLHSNNYGTIALNSPNIWVRAGIIGGVDMNKTMRFVYGADIIDRFSGQNELILQQAYVGMVIGPFILKGGRYEEVFGNHDQSLSSGGLIWSGNARPIPEISIASSDYISVPFTKKFVEFKGGLSHGWLGDDITVNDILLHHKYLYVRFGGELPVKLHYGLHHFAQWSGYSSNPDYGQLPHGFSTFKKVFMAEGGSPGAYWTEYLNATGNHIGSHNLGIDVKLRNQEIKFYWQTIFEDGSGLRLRNIRDGLWGIKISFKSFNYISGILAEYINTTDQSGTFDQYYENDTLKFAGGNDNYFNSGVYEGGWTYNGRTIGTPLITSPEIMSSTTGPCLINNKISALHLGIEGRIDLIDYKAFYTFSRNRGTNVGEFPGGKIQHSVLIKGSMDEVSPWNLSFSAAIAFDVGKLFEKNVGVMFSLKKKSILRSSELLK